MVSAGLVLFLIEEEHMFCVFLCSLFWVAFLKQSLNRLQVESVNVAKSQPTSTKDAVEYVAAYTEGFVQTGLWRSINSWL
jgi:hypothetical protein